jgi:hypothetical protein
VLLQLNMHYKTRVALKLTGIPAGAVPRAAASPAEAAAAAAEPNGSSKKKPAPAEPPA